MQTLTSIQYRLFFPKLLLFIAYVSIAYVVQQYLQDIIQSMSQLGLFAPLLFLILYCVMSIFCLPNLPLVLAGGLLYGMVGGTLLNLLGATLGAICGFCITRFRFSHLSTARLESNHRLNRMLKHVDKRGWQSVALLRLTPAVPYNLVNYCMGMTQIKFSHYLIATMIFLIPNKIMLTYCGYAGKSLFSLFS